MARRRGPNVTMEPEPLRPTSSWICDSCKRPIENAEHGYVEWVGVPIPGEDTRLRWRDMRIVHHKPYSQLPHGCQFNAKHERARDGGSIGDEALVRFQGPDGLMDLLSYIHEGELPIPEGFEIIKRIHIPGYELARRHFKEALDNEVISDNVLFGYWPQKDLRRVLEAFGNQS